MMPIVSRKRRTVDDAGDMVEECKSDSRDKAHISDIYSDWDMVFPDDEREANPASFKFLEMAHKWKQMQAAKGGSGGGGGGGLGAMLAAASKSTSVSAAAETREQQDKSDEEMASSDDGDD